MTDDPTRPTDTPAEPTDTPPAADAAAEPQPEAAAAPEAASAQPAPDPSAEMSNGATTPPATTQAVTAVPGANRARWAIGLGIAGLAVAAAIAAFIVLGSRPVPEALKYIPADAAMVVEIRPELPGDQLQKLGNLLAHFPGFKDQSTLPAKLDETFSRLVGAGSGGVVDYRADLKPWLSGPAFVALRPSPDASAQDPQSFARGVVSLSTTGTVSCDTPLKGQTVTHEKYKGYDLALGSNEGACVIDGRQALIGDPVSVRAAIDAKAGGSGLDRNASYQKARASLQGDQLLTAYINGAAYTSFSAKLLEGMSGTPGLPNFAGMLPSFPEWIVEGFRAEDEALVIDAITAAPLAPTAGATPAYSLLPIPAAHASNLTSMAPAGTLFFLEAQGAGVGLQNMLTVLKGFPELKPALQMLDGAGGAGQLVGWIEDFGVIVVNGSDGPTGGIMLAATDEAAATQRVSTILGLLAFAGLGNNSVQTRESTIGGVTVTTITISDISSLVPPGQLPPGVGVPPDAKVEFSIATKGKVVLLGTGESFMNAVLAVPAGSGLVDQALYKRATTRALPGSQMTMYVGIHDIVALVESTLPADAKARWESDLKPYFAPFEALSVTSSTTDGQASHGRFTLTVGNP